MLVLRLWLVLVGILTFQCVHVFPQQHEKDELIAKNRRSEASQLLVKSVSSNDEEVFNG